MILSLLRSLLPAAARGGGRVPAASAYSFDEASYRTRHPEIAADASALHHYLDVGRPAGAPPNGRGTEGAAPDPAVAPSRPPRAPNRMARLRTYASPGAKILEIGASYNPIAPRRAGYDAYVLDNVDREGLLARYADHPNVNFEAIEDVDFVAREGTLFESVPREHWSSFDVIYLSHVLEHVPNPISFLRDLQKLVRVDGAVVMAVPDKRCCFDFFRPVATTGAWLDAFAAADRGFRAGDVFDFYTMSVVNDRRISWNWSALRKEQVGLIGMTIGQAYDRLYGAGAAEPAPDCHVWTFTPSVLTLLLHDCHALGLVTLAPVSVTECVDFEFFVELRLQDRPPINQAARLALLRRAAAEQRDGYALARG